MKNFRWSIMLTSLVAALVIISGGYVLYERYLRENPLKDSLEAIDEVDKVEIIRNGKVIHADIYLAYTEEFPEVVQEIENTMEKHATEGYTFTVHDKANANLSGYKKEVTPALFEGARNGNYRSVKETVMAEARELKLDEIIFSVDEKRIYLQAKDGKYFMYIMVPISGGTDVG